MPPREFFIVRDYSTWRDAATPRVDDSSDDDSLDGLIEARATSWSDEVVARPPSAPAASWGRDLDEDSEDERRAAAAAANDDDYSESEEEEEEDFYEEEADNAPPRKRPRASAAAARPRKRPRTTAAPRRTSFLSNYYGVTLKTGTKKFMARAGADVTDVESRGRRGEDTASI
mmetsp:Transcript_3801/g.11809  ORF Transcript_3801/g.11809 Transcript_3801/m.11809 type:complete len:173 (-) Transcript_3801:742-1260(-)